MSWWQVFLRNDEKSVFYSVPSVVKNNKEDTMSSWVDYLFSILKVKTFVFQANRFITDGTIYG